MLALLAVLAVKIKKQGFVYHRVTEQVKNGRRLKTSQHSQQIIM
jgi:hypothetical protein